MLGGNLVKNYPVIDKFIKGVGTNIKTMDLKAPTYLKNKNVYNTLKGYVDKLFEFKGANVGGVNTYGQIQSKVLEVGIHRGVTKAQITQINNAINYAKSLGIDMFVRVVK